MRQHPDEREAILKELVLRLIECGMYRRALDEIDLYLPSFPYQDNPVLHIYAGLLALYLAQPKLGEQVPNHERPWDNGLLRDAQTHLERAKAIDPDNLVAIAFIEQIPIITQSPRGRQPIESDEESLDIDVKGQRRKRVKT
ncbi:uncharacterized protein FIBRA_07783 [Fibroporia radiculosa]|uniref:Uncharacterized protein n=1 Tax=Fibroporia radiculosa TaxID=599839 RepID=J4IC02_9APHY|nr:uncharacterized protein FIBRA_07783 [Fibroporia radiculosa]CCM05556.1 predicted protein [Fibroporia radiculosa]